MITCSDDYPLRRYVSYISSHEVSILSSDWIMTSEYISITVDNAPHVQHPILEEDGPGQHLQ